MQSSKAELILLYRGMRVHPSGIVDIMLSPQFYITKQEELPIKYLYQAKRLAPSILGELLVDGVEYHYHIFKEGSRWVFIAYDIDSIKKFLQEHGIATKSIGRLYFAQQYASKFVRPMLLDSGELLSTIQDTVVILPKSLVDKDTYYSRFNIDINPKDSISIPLNSSSILSQRDSIILSAILLCFGIVFTIEGLRYSSLIDSMRGEVDRVLEDYPSLQSSYARDNIAKKYQTIDTKERHKREILKNLSNLVAKDISVESLKMDNKKFVAIFKSKKPKLLLNIKVTAQSKGYSAVNPTDNTLIEIKGEI
jgi:hypothetical protein